MIHPDFGIDRQLKAWKEQSPEQERTWTFKPVAVTADRPRMPDEEVECRLEWKWEGQDYWIVHQGRDMLQAGERALREFKKWEKYR